MTPHRLPDIVAHADWSVNPGKQRVAVAVRNGSRYRLDIAAGGWLAKTLVLSDIPETVLVGFDFPIGVPGTFADRARIASLPEWLREIDDQTWAVFRNIADHATAISLDRPFFPRARGTRHELQRGLGLEWDQLFRVCERKTDSRGDACPLFWTLGAKQVGRLLSTDGNESCGRR